MPSLFHLPGRVLDLCPAEEGYFVKVISPGPQQPAALVIPSVHGLATAETSYSLPLGVAIADARRAVWTARDVPSLEKPTDLHPTYARQMPMPSHCALVLEGAVCDGEGLYLRAMAAWGAEFQMDTLNTLPTKPCETGYRSAPVAGEMHIQGADAKEHQLADSTEPAKVDTSAQGSRVYRLADLAESADTYTPAQRTGIPTC